MVNYILDASQVVNRAEKKFNIAFSLLSSTEKELYRAKRHFEECTTFLETVGTEAIYKPDMQKDARVAEVGIRRYERRIQKLERELEIYRHAKNQAEEEWKQLVTQVDRRIVVFDPVHGEGGFTFLNGGLEQYN